MTNQRAGRTDLHAHTAQGAFILEDFDPPPAQKDGVKRADRHAGSAFYTLRGIDR